MKHNFFRSGLLILLILVLGACSKKEEAPVAPSAGELVFNKNCKSCHAQGINGAPIVGNKTMWGPRLPKGEDALVQSALNGVGLMPARGGKDGKGNNPFLTDEDIRLAVQFMMSKVQ